MQNTTSYNKPQDASTPAVKAEAPIVGGKCDSGPAGMGGVSTTSSNSMGGGSSDMSGAGMGGKTDNIGGQGEKPACCAGMGDGGYCAGMGGKAENVPVAADKKTPAPEVAQGGALQTYDGAAGWKS